MDYYNWKSHYAVQLRKLKSEGAFTHYGIETETGKGEVISCTVFPGVQAVYNVLNLFHCGRTVPRTEKIVEINYCMDGRYECEVNSRYCFYASPGDLSIGNAGRREAAGNFPTGRFSGLTLFIELASAGNQNAFLLREMDIDFNVIIRMATQEPRRFYLRGRKIIDAVCQQMISAVTDHSLAFLKLKTLELLMLISDPELLGGSNMPAYLSRKNVQLAEKARQRLTDDLSRHVTLRQLSAELNASPTAIKSAFKNVYGESIRDHMKNIRLQEAQRLLRETNRPIAEIAEMVGYANPGHFAVAFREKYAMTPGEYKSVSNQADNRGKIQDSATKRPSNIEKTAMVKNF